MQDTNFSNEPIDQVFKYVDGEHIDQHHIDRAKAKQMTIEEEEAFFHHIDQCSLCAQKMENELKKGK